MRFKKLQPSKLKGMAAMFFGAGGLGIVVGLLNNQFFMAAMGTGFICIGGLIGYMLLTKQYQRDPRKRKK